MDEEAVTRRPRRWPWVVAVVAIAGAALGGWWFGGSKPDAQAARKGPGPTPVVTTVAEARDVPVRVKANGTVTPIQSVDVRAQITSTVREVHIREGQAVRQGDLLFTLDSRTEEANLKKAQAQVEKDRADLATAQRNLERQRELFRQKFIAQAALDAVQNQVDTLTGQLAIDTAAVEGAKVAIAYTQIRAPFSGRTGTIAVRAGSLVQASNTAATPPLVTITQVDPITVSFTLPERELPAMQRAISGGGLEVTAVPQAGGAGFKGQVIFLDNTVDVATGTIRVKAQFANPRAELWPGMYVNVEAAPRTIANAVVLPPQAVQTGPDNRFVYVVGQDGKVAARPVTLAYVEEKFAVVDGVPAGSRVVVEGAQNLRPGGQVTEADRQGKGEGKGKAKGEGKGEGKGGKAS